VAQGLHFAALPGMLAVVAGVGALSSGWSRVPWSFPSYLALPHLVGGQLGPLHLALGGALTGIAAAIAGAIAAKIFADRRPTAAPGGAAARTRAKQDAGSEDAEPSAKPFGSPPPPSARIRLALPPEEPDLPDAPTDADPSSEPGEASAG
jgi:hypothetical protein